MNSDRQGCQAVENDLALWVGEELLEDSRSRVEAHLPHCSHCQHEVQRLRETQRILRAGLYRGAPAGLDLWSGIQAQLEREGVLTRQPTAPVAPLRPAAARAPRGWRWAAASLAAASLFALGLWVGQRERVLPNENPSSSLPTPIAELRPSQPNTPSASPAGLRRLSASDLPLSATAEPLEGGPSLPLEWIPQAPRGNAAAAQQRLLH